MVPYVVLQAEKNTAHGNIWETALIVTLFQSAGTRWASFRRVDLSSGQPLSFICHAHWPSVNKYKVRESKHMESKYLAGSTPI